MDSTKSNTLLLLVMQTISCGDQGDNTDAGADTHAAWDVQQIPEDGLPSCGPQEPPWVPYVAGEYVRVFRPDGTRYLNDHTIVQTDEGVYHLFGITHESLGTPQAEIAFLHASSRRIEGPWETLPDALLATEPETNLWAPHVISRGPRSWTMYYYGSTPDHRILRADSENLNVWHRTSFSAPGGRDPFAMRVGTNWLLYSVGVSSASEGQILVTTSADMVSWSEPSVVVQDPIPSLGWGNLESPNVAYRDGWYFLFVTRTSDSMIDYVRTLVFASRDPVHFPWSPQTEIFSHAAEVIQFDNRWYITSAGWTSYVGERWRGLSIAPLSWAARCH